MKIHGRMALLICLALFMFSSVFAAVEPAGSDFYDFAAKLRAKYGIGAYRTSRPWTSSQMEAFLRSAQSSGERMTATEKKTLAGFLKRISGAGRVSLLHAGTGEYQTGINLSGRLGYVGGEYVAGIKESADYVIYTSGITASGTLGKTAEYFMSFNDETASGAGALLGSVRSLTYDDGAGGTVTDSRSGLFYFKRAHGYGWFNFNTERDEAYFDRTDVIFEIKLPFCAVSAGKFSDSWGPAAWDNLMLSENATSFNQIRFVFETGPLTLISLSGGLRTEELDPGSGIEVANGDVKYSYRKKYLAAHRLEADLGRLSLGFNEAVVYTDKDLQLGYMIPMNIYWSEQHYEGDRDNTVMGMDFSYVPADGIHLYGELFLDDLSLRQLGDYRHTKAAYIIGASVYPSFAKDVAIRAEYSRVNPFVYTHRFVTDSYTHYYTGLGSQLMPNSDRIKAAAEWTPLPGLDITLSGSLTRHGDVYVDEDGAFVNTGGDLSYPDIAGDSDDAADLCFLKGERSGILSAGIHFRYALRDVFISPGIPAGLFTVEGGVSRDRVKYDYPGDGGTPAPDDLAQWGVYFMLGYNYGY